MKNIILILLVLLVSLSGCKKTDEKIEEKIVGHWKVKMTKIQKENPILRLSPDNLPGEFTLLESGEFVNSSGLPTEWSMPCSTLPCSTKYYVENSSLYILVDLKEDGVDDLKYYEIPIIKVNNRKLKLLDNRIKGGTSEYTFIKQD